MTVRHIKHNEDQMWPIPNSNTIAYCQPLTAENCTVLGYEVGAEEAMWQGLDFTDAWIDEGPHLLHPDRSQYLHVSFTHVDGHPADKVVYRVRSLVQIKDKFAVAMPNLDTLWVSVVGIEVKQMPAGERDIPWMWKYQLVYSEEP